MISAKYVSGVLMYLICVSLSFGQRPELNSITKIQAPRLQPGEAGYGVRLQDGTTNFRTVNLAEELRLIVEFKEDPLFVQQLRRPSAALQKSSIQARFSRFSSDLGSVFQSTSSRHRVPLSQPVVSREYYKAFYGASIKVPRVMLSQIQGLPYVKTIHRDEQVQAVVDSSVHIVRADSVWAKYGTQGEGVVVGIIDTGIDYFHPALGDSAFPNSKVIGGEDFTRPDGDPFDDNGHGTHVAGIVAADGSSIKGVAPKAKLMAFKVLDAEGFGSYSDVVAAIERTADPNNDDNFSDRLDVVNISLGGLGNSDDALSIAVDNATMLGVTFCVAAGNGGDFRRVLSPGSARTAITVGASDKSDKLAWFSSKGPTPKFYAIKPDVVAPGVNIRSTFSSGEYEEFSGTSMATPHVAGVSALLKAIHPSWSPANIKSALVTTAVDLGEEVMAQGGGRIDALRAAQITSFVMPPSLSFGMDDSILDEWNRSDTMWVYNTDVTTQSYSISTGVPPLGVALTASPSMFSVVSHDSQMVVVSLVVTNGLVPYPDSGSLAYSGTIQISGTKDFMKVGWAFVKAARVILSFDQSSSFAIVGKKFAAFAFDADSLGEKYAELAIPRGTYDIYANFFPGEIMLVIREQVQINDFFSDSIKSSEAAYSISIHGRDDQGQNLSQYPAAEKLYMVAFPDSSYVKEWLYFGFGDVVYVSSISERFAFLAGEYGFDGVGKAVVVQHQPAKNIQENIVLTNSPDFFVKQYINVDFTPNATSGGVSVAFWEKIVGEYGAFYIGFAPPDPAMGPGRYWNGVIFMNRDVHPRYGFTASFEAFNSTLGTTEFYLSTPPVNIVRDSLGVFWGNIPPLNAFLSPKEGILRFGGAPIYSDAFHLNNFFGKSNVAAFPGFLGPLDEFRSGLFTRTTLYDDRDAVVASDSGRYLSPRELSPGIYRTEVIDRGYFVNSLRGTATLSARFDLRKQDSNPPGLSSLRIMNSQKRPYSSLKTREQALIVFSANDLQLYELTGGGFAFKYQSVADSTKAYFREHGTSVWIPLDISLFAEDSTSLLRVGKCYTADVSATTQFDSAAIDLKFLLQDQSGNTTEFTLEPAYGVGNYGTPTGIESERVAGIVPKEFALYQNYPNPFNPQTQITFDLPRPTKVDLRVYNVLGQLVATLTSEEKDAGHYEMTWNGRGDQGLLSSGVYFYRLQAGDFVQTRKLLLLR